MIAFSSKKKLNTTLYLSVPQLRRIEHAHFKIKLTINGLSNFPID